ncbi:MAG: hypothetical protein MUO21_05655, partial [Nitrososphaeraceae archaeon]|nr:hypothetical protein [Nitrososphaeraceae archaeon]
MSCGNVNININLQQDLFDMNIITNSNSDKYYVWLYSSNYGNTWWCYKRDTCEQVEKIYEDYSKYTPYKEVKKEKVKTQVFEGYRVTYSWEYDNSVIIYYLRYNDYACIIYGYGA